MLTLRLHHASLRRAAIRAAMRGKEALLYSFETRRPSDDAGAPPRTVGWTALVPGRAPHGHQAEREAVRVCTTAHAIPAPPEAARDKVVLCDLGGKTLVYQGDRDRRAASLCACGNASATAAALLAQLLGAARLTHTLVLPDGEVRMEARARRSANGWRISQWWKGVRFQAREVRLAGHEVAICTGALNDYLLIHLPSAEAVAAFSLEDATALWRAGEAFGLTDPLRGRLAAVSPEGETRFFTCGRRHPGAPLTGLAVLALAAREVGWLTPLRGAGRIVHPRGTDALPNVMASPNGMEIELSPVDVALRRA